MRELGCQAFISQCIRFVANVMLSRQLSIAVTLEPRSPGAHTNYASTLHSLGNSQLSYEHRVLAHKMAWRNESKHSTLIELGIGAFGVMKTELAITHFRVRFVHSVPQTDGIVTEST